MGGCCSGGMGGLFGPAGGDAAGDDPSSYLTAEEMEGDRDTEATMENSTLRQVCARLTPHPNTMNPTGREEPQLVAKLDLAGAYVHGVRGEGVGHMRGTLDNLEPELLQYTSSPPTTGVRLAGSPVSQFSAPWAIPGGEFLVESSWLGFHVPSSGL
jgi:hypothetical protein